MADVSRRRGIPIGEEATQVPIRSGSIVTDGRVERRTRYSGQVAGILAAATTLSIAHTVHTTLTLAPDYGKDPTLYLLYGILWGLVALARTDRRPAWWAIGTLLTALIAIGIFYYPVIFVPAWQTPFGWFENDVYMGLLMVALYLTIQRLRGVVIAAGQ
jgi:peptidoglycan/LPS O-acetylase OafA/YrhL